MPNRMEELASKGMGKAKAVKVGAKGLKGVFKKLAEEHGEVAALLKRVAASDDPDVRADLFPKIRAELLSHERGELTELYPQLRSHDETRAIVEDHEQEAKELEAQLEDLDGRRFDDPSWDKRFHDLIELVEHHTTEEENEYFPRAQQALGAQAAEDLLEPYMAKKQAVLERLK